MFKSWINLKMFTTKLEVDKHVENNLKKINSEKERNLRGYAFGKLYYKVGDYESARRFVSAYLQVKPTAEAYNLLGKAFEKLEKYDSALEAYRRSFELDSKQNNLLIKICELLSLENSNFDLSGARYYCEKAQKIDPQNPVLYTLKEKIITLESNNPNDVTKLYLNELETQPTNISLRIKLVRHLLQNNEIGEAYKQVSELEHKNLPVFRNSLAWYEASAEVLLKYQRDNILSSNLTWEFWMLLITVLDKLSALSLDEYFTNTKSNADCLTCVYNFDQTLFLAHEKLKDCPERSLIQECINHYKGQLSLYLTTLIFKQAKKDLINFKEASQITLPLLLIAYHTQPPDLHSIWLDHANDKYKQLIQRWHVEASYRCSQAGHLLLTMAKDKASVILEKAQQHCSGMWRPQLYKKLFITRDQQVKMKSSFFANNSSFTEITIALPNKNNILKHDQVAQLLYPNSLHHLVWIGLHTILPLFHCSVFEGLAYSAKHLDSSSAESLSLLDIQAFFYCTVLCAQLQIEESKKNIYHTSDRPETLPAAITQHLGTANQHKWFTFAYKMYKKEYTANLVEIRTVLVRGLEVVRCIGNHGLDVQLLIKLARIFSERTKHCSKQSEIEANDARAELYWKTALTILEKLKNKQAVSYSKDRLFEYKSKPMSPDGIFAAIDEAKLFIGTRFMRNKDYERALSVFENLRDPYASFHQAEIYQKMAEDQMNQNKGKLTPEMRSQYVILLTRARDSLFLTLDRLRDPSVDRNHPLNRQLSGEIENIEALLSKYEYDVNGYRSEYDGLTEENASFIGSIGDNANVHTIHTLPNSSLINGTFTPKKDHSHSLYLTPRLETSFRSEARPSPERLDAQLRQMQAARDSALTQILEQNRLMVESLKEVIKTTVDELKSVKSSVDELKDIKKSMDDLRNAVDELQNFHNITDMVQEMKKEIAELKSSSNKTKTNQLSDEDLYVLDEDYTGDYNINTNLGNLNQGLYPNYQNRVPASNPLSYTPLYPGIYPPLYPFPGLGLPQAGALPFGQETQIHDFRGVAQNLSQTQNLYGQPAFSQTGLNQPILNQPILSQPLNAQGINQLPNQLSFPHLSMSQQTLGQSTSLGQATGLTGSPLVQSNIFKDKLDSSISSPAVLPSPITSSYIPSTVPINRAPPVNVVITASDPLPKTAAQTTQVLSVTIPPQHLKGNLPPKSQPHGYQIPVPLASMQTTFSAPSVIQSTSTTTTQSLSTYLSGLAVSSSDKTLTQSLTQSFDKNDKSNSSIASVEEHDPCPDFKPIIPLPAEVPVNTGEEDETVLFCRRAKLFRYVNKEWKERGIGNLKILKNKTTGKIRILMRREQVHKICANHFITKDMYLTLMPNSDRAYMWVANDFADEELVLEKLCARFKMAEEAKEFYDAFEKAKNNLPAPESTEEPDGRKSVSNLEPNKKETTQTMGLGDFVFTSTPTFKLKDNTANVTVTTAQEETPKKVNPFAAFSFNKSNTETAPSLNFSLSAQKSDDKASSLEKSVSNTQPLATNDDSHAEDFQPTVEFKPVIPLPDLVDVKTGEEGSEVLFQSRVKLLRFDTETKEWKERGIGDMKILKDKTIRLVMRREQVLKVCCNHQLFKNTAFSKMSTTPKALTWYAQDFSEGVLKPEMFAVRFKTEEQADEFLKAIQSAQAMLDENNVVKDLKETREPSQTATPKTTSRDDKKIKSTPPEPSPKPAELPKHGWGDKFKPKTGSWECKNCYIINDSKDSYCIACETPKIGTTPKKSDSGESGPQFSFGFQVSSGFSFGSTSVTTTPSDISKADSTTSVDSAILAPYPKSNLFTPTWGDTFKPKEDSWSCSECFVRNDGDKLYCAACESPKLDTVPKKEANRGISLETPGLKFTFGIPSSTSASPSVPSLGATSTTSVTSTASHSGFLFGTPVSNTSTTSFPTFGIPSSTNVTSTPTTFTFSSSSFSFGKPKVSDTTPTITDTINVSKPFNFSLAVPSKEENKEQKEHENKEFVFGSPQKYTFEFTPRSPRRQSSGQGEEESDNSYVEDEGDHIYFKPVIPLPDKIEVKTGEEQEEVLYCHRAKLFRFVQSEWKERGIGDLKILFNSETGKLRVVMRRDQVLKICLNHVLTRDIEYRAKDDKTWLFSAPDFSEGEINQWQFCLRFKNAEIAQNFKKTVEDALDKSDNTKLDEGSTSKTVIDENKTAKESDSDVEFVSETTVTLDEEKEALRLGLPPKFLSYRQLPDCNCATCKKDDEILAPLFKGDQVQQQSKTTTEIKSKSSLPMFGTPDKSGTSSKFVFGTPSAVTTASTTFSFGSVNNAVSTKTDVLKTILTKPSVFENAAKGQAKKEESVSSTEPSKPTDKTPAKTTFSLKTSDNSSFTNVTSGSKSLIAPPSFVFEKQANDNAVSSSLNTFSFQPTNTNTFSTSTSSLFSMPTTSSSTGSIFGGANNIFNKSASGGNIFGETTQPTSTTSTSVFGSPANIFQNTTTTTTNIFSAAPITTASANIFGATVTTSTGNIFSPSTNGSTFTSSPFAIKTPSTTNNIFNTSTESKVSPLNASIFNKEAATPATATGMFGSEVTAKTGAKTEDKGDSDVKTIFDSALNTSAVVTSGTDDSAKEPDFLKVDPGLSFASLATKNLAIVESSLFRSSDKDEQPFAFLGAGAPVFSSVSATKPKSAEKKKKDKSKTKSDDEAEKEEEVEGGGADEEYDPHYEPIIPLPEQIVVQTGEEEEQALFNERGKVYRFDANTKEWKERGVGNLKILHHPQNGTYRLLLRREQVHKVVLNMLIIPDLELQPLSTSDKAWMWCGYNYTDDGTSQLEKLAARFKTVELAKQFYDTVMEAISAIKAVQESKSLPSSVQTFGQNTTYETGQNDEGEEEEEEDDEDSDVDDEEDEDDERTIMFAKPCTLSEETAPGEWKDVITGELEVFYDSEIYGVRICVNDMSGEVISSTMIGVNVSMEQKENQCTWKAVEWATQNPYRRHLRATFSTVEDAEEFHMSYLEGLQCAQGTEIYDDVYLEYVNEEQ